MWYSFKYSHFVYLQCFISLPNSRLVCSKVGNGTLHFYLSITNAFSFIWNFASILVLKPNSLDKIKRIYTHVLTILSHDEKIFSFFFSMKGNGIYQFALKLQFSFSLKWHLQFLKLHFIYVSQVYSMYLCYLSRCRFLYTIVILHFC